jgi:hypothetical protein
MSRLRTGPQPSLQVRGSRSRDGVPAPPGAVLLVVARLRVLWNLTSPVDDTATLGRLVSVKRSPTPNQPSTSLPECGGIKPM